MSAEAAPMQNAAVILTPPGGVPTRVAVEVMRSDAERERGLMYRTELATDHGMLFLFASDDIHTFWMKNTYIPLDMIFIAQDLTVAGVVANAEPRTLTGRTIGKPSRHVLEVTAGWAAAHGVGPGTRVRLEAIDLKGVAP
jgi:uncharacterized membrane protein (UPF0127 family)